MYCLPLAAGVTSWCGAHPFLHDRGGLLLLQPTGPATGHARGAGTGGRDVVVRRGKTTIMGRLPHRPYSMTDAMTELSDSIGEPAAGAGVHANGRPARAQPCCRRGLQRPLTPTGQVNGLRLLEARDRARAPGATCRAHEALSSCVGWWPYPQSVSSYKRSPGCESAGIPRVCHTLLIYRTRIRTSGRRK